MILQVVDNFYEDNDFKKIKDSSLQINYLSTYQPFNEKYETRFDAYPCYEYDITNENNLYNIFYNTFAQKLNIPILNLNIKFRKVVTDELKKSPFNNHSLGFIHQDKSADIAGVIYLNNESLKSGTSFHNNANHLIPNMIIGAKPNRLICYSASYFHAANINFLDDVRYTQVFFIKVKI